MNKYWKLYSERPKLIGFINALFINIVICFIAVCIYSSCILRYTDNTFMMRDGKELKFNKKDLPLDCFYLKDVPKLYVTAYEEMRVKINFEVSVDLFSKCVPWIFNKEPTYAPNGTVLIRMYESDNDFYGAFALVRYLDSGLILSSQIYINKGFKGDLLLKLMLHEMLHSIGLEHDNSRYSIMNATVTDYANEITYQDIISLYKAYSK